MDWKKRGLVELREKSVFIGSIFWRKAEMGFGLTISKHSAENAFIAPNEIRFARVDGGVGAEFVFCGVL